ncbi:LuxR C-terminal-related transcriptional regulator [Rhodococcus sp. T7]|jgi:DNA-binding CsgD family transcriptional regulator|uniref:LuxR C-terminal-related transcriptional regulator n=1 Tax=Rhodococcus sp. T7 TaxID=627444 RepID=UPI0013576A59|nr:LuxR C-terminal-related transcriptional regulator [Rhodococcus sp. T7]
MSSLDRRQSDVMLDADVTAQVRELGIAAGDVLDCSIPVAECSRVSSAKRLLTQVWDSAVSEMNRLGACPTPPRLAELTGLLGRVRELESLVEDVRVAEGVETMRRIRRALGRLQALPTANELLSQAAAEACTMGFERGLVSTIGDATWDLHSMVIERDPRLAQDMVAAGRGNPPKLDGSIIESDVVDRARSGLVFDVQSNPRVNRQLVSMSGCTSYIVAPLRSHGKVVGLVHADRYPVRDVDVTDRAVLNLYAEGLSHTLARVSVMEGLNSLSQGMARLMSDVKIAATPEIAKNDARHPVLSTREVDVIELMAAGDANRSIARKLSISEGTVKTHITHILRKLDASNRAEAVAYWLRR